MLSHEHKHATVLITILVVDLLVFVGAVALVVWFAKSLLG